MARAEKGSSEKIMPHCHRDRRKKIGPSGSPNRISVCRSADAGIAAENLVDFPLAEDFEDGSAAGAVVTAAGVDATFDARAVKVAGRIEEQAGGGISGVAEWSGE